MRWIYKLPLRLRSLFRKSRVEQELDEEMRFHLEKMIEENIASGMSAEEARYAALRQFGNVGAVKEECRDSWGVRMISELGQDVRYGLRQLRRNPGFTIVAILTLSLGIGANTVIFSMVNGLLFRPLPFRDPGRVYTLSADIKGGGTSNGFSYPDLKEIRRQTSSVFSEVAGVQLFGVTGLSEGGSSERMWTQFVTGNFFNLSGIRPAIGRLILPTEGQIAGADPVLVLDYSFWKTRFGGDPDIVGKEASVDGQPVTIVGVTPKGFRSVSSFVEAQGYMPLGMAVVTHQVKRDFLGDRRAKTMVLIARMKPKVSNREIRANMAVVARRLAAEYPKADDWTNLNAFPLPPTGPTSHPPRSLAVLSALFLTLAAVVFLVACLNVANILLARTSVRQHEMAVRSALGETRGRLIWRLLTECLLLAFLGFAGGVVLGVAGSHALGRLPLHMSSPIVLDFQFDWRVLAYAFAVALLAGAITGIVPALRTARGDVNEILHGAGQSAMAKGHRFRKMLVVLQVGGSLMLLIVAGLFVRNLLNAQESDLGFDPHHVLNITIDPHLAGYNQEQSYQFMQRVLEGARALPGVHSASLAATVPMGSNSMGDTLVIQGAGSSPSQHPPFAGLNIVSPGYFETMRIPLLRGRFFRQTDDRKPVRVAAINQAMADDFWPGQNPIGKQFSSMEDPNRLLEVVGVVGNSRTGNLFSPEGPYFYIPLAQDRQMSLTLQVRTAGSPNSEEQGIIGLIKSLDRAMPLINVQTMNEALDTLNGLLLFRWGAALAVALGFLGLILATVGTYGIISYVAAQRTHEIGIRMALGARQGDILKMVLWEGTFIIALGTVLGIFGAFAIAQLVGHFLVGVNPTDPLTFTSITVMVAATALAASYIPARRAAKVDPMVALRYE
jgi:putative ABC transport system permease protein